MEKNILRGSVNENNPPVHKEANIFPYLWREGHKGQGNPFQFFSPIQTLLAVIKYPKNHLFLEICVLGS